MAKIIQLSTQLSNLIAAGEVVERPASVVKELVENAIDAGAGSITVEIQNGGMTLLRVQDDGCGMDPEDAETAFLRHATSKLRSKEDLGAIATLGFRGEALAATAAVSRIDLLTRTAEAEEGVHLRLEAGRLLERESAGCPVGTTMIVRDLFFNTPARMKFMKQDSAEGAAVLAAVQKQALAHPECAFRFLADGEERLQTAGDGELQSAVYSVLGRQLALDMTPVDSGWEHVQLSGFVSRPTATRGTRSQEFFFVNGRYIRSKLLSAALEEAYRNNISVGRFPACVLNLTLPPEAVDVNVHPAKTEVKFLREKDVFDCVHYGVLGALNKLSGRVQMELPKVPAAEAPAARDSQPAAPAPVQKIAGNSAAPQVHSAARQSAGFRTMSAEEYRSLLETFEKSAQVTPSESFRREAQRFPRLHQTVMIPQSPADEPHRQPAAADAAQELPVLQSSAEEAQADAAVLSAQTQIGDPAPAEDTPDGAAAEDAQQTLPLPRVSFRVIGEALDTYLLVEQDDCLLLIDKHAAHERILFERLLAQGVQIPGQLLLAPLTCTLAPEEAAALVQQQALVESLGFDFDSLGDGTLLLRQIPADLDEGEAESSLAEIAGHLQRGVRDTPERLREQLLHSIACKAAIKGGWRTDPYERDRLAEQVLSREDLKYCPHGRPICLTLTRRQLEKQFKRTT